jgi:DNA repair protein RadC
MEKRIKTVRVVQGWRVAETELEEKTYGYRIINSDRVGDVFSFLRYEVKEQFWVALLDGKHNIKAIHRVSEGTVCSSLVHSREVFCAAILECASAIIAIHNHPSGNPSPSPEDLAVTTRLKRAGRLLGIPLIDHVIIGDPENRSIRNTSSIWTT